MSTSFKPSKVFNPNSVISFKGFFLKEDENLTAYADQPEEYFQLTKNFHQKARELGYGEVTDYFWYHTLDLGNGLITPGTYDYRSSLPAFQFPSLMSGWDVLDIGSATGFFAFEFEKRGATVTSVEIPSMADLDAFPGESLGQTLKKIERMMPSHTALEKEQQERLFRANSPEKVYHFLLDGPFKFCHRVLNSKVKRCYSTIYSLSAEKLGTKAFDLVFIGDVLLHTLYPLKALAAVTPLCRGTLVISQILPNISETQPVMLYVGGDQLGEDEVSWWWPNRLCFEQMLKKLGFRKVEVVGHHTGIVRPGGGSYDRAIIHAVK